MLFRSQVTILKETLRQIRENAQSEPETSDEDDYIIIPETDDTLENPNQEGPDGNQ